MDENFVAVLVTTDSDRRGVFAGLIEESKIAEGLVTGVVVLKDARNCIFWHSSIGGFLGLAATGPNGECRIGATAPMLALNGVTSIAVLSPTAQRSWTEAAVYGVE